MRKLLTVGLAALLALSLVPAASAQKKKPPQTVEGSILLPAPFAPDQFAGCWGGLNRRLTTLGQGEPNGLFGYVFDVDKATWNKSFKLDVTGGEGDVDLDLFLYIHYPPFEETADDPVNGGTPASVDYQTREAGGEAGVVPPNTVKGIVCMYGGPSHYGYNATFKYVAGGAAPAKKKKK